VDVLGEIAMHNGCSQSEAKMKKDVRWFGSVLISAAVLLSGCFSGKAPLDVLKYEARPRNENLIVFMRGMGGTLNCVIDSHGCFETESFVTAVLDRGLPYDMVAPNAHFGYYRERTLQERLRTDVILPARAAGYRKIWLVGVSMGGLGALLYTCLHPEDVQGVLTLGPYLGDDDIIEEIMDAGGVSEWQPGEYDPTEDWQRMLWDWLKHYPHQSDSRAPIYIGIADADPYFRDQELLAQYLPSGRAIMVEGKHRFSTFKKAWEIFLNRGLLR
jgi:pimeloyl-ACP methyl ester carboxylesterase